MIAFGTARVSMLNRTRIFRANQKIGKLYAKILLPSSKNNSKEEIFTDITDNN